MTKPVLLPSKGRLLISEPALYDFYFKQSIVLLAEHNEDGSFGLIINKPIDVKFNDIIKNFPDFNSLIYLGGPVKTDNIFVLHSLGEKIDNSTKIMEGLYWGGNIETIKKLIIANKIKTHQMHFFVGYSSWAPKQLDNEMEEKSWLVTDAKLSDIFNTEPKTQWSNLMKDFGKDYAIWANFPSDPIMN